jgi:DNA-binding PadR family transcriptional regulator
MSKALGRDEVRTLVLHVLLRGPNHGYAIARAVERDSSEALRLGEGTLYPVLRSLEQDGLVISEWETVEVGPARKVYRITTAGRAECARRVAEWRDRVTAIGAVLGLDGAEPTALRHA